MFYLLTPQVDKSLSTLHSDLQGHFYNQEVNLPVLKLEET